MEGRPPPGRPPGVPDPTGAAGAGGGYAALTSRLFRELGFVRKQCPRCKSYFWTLNREQAYCGDQPCVPYGFINNPPASRLPESVSQLRERFLRFFEARGHARVKRYPVVARWRDDVYLVGASIYDFQPWVTSGAVPPPANPLVISQPSIRLTDVDKVGRSGRHLTGFEMMAHHAFNYPEKYVYWIDETVEYAYEFFAKELGIAPEEITFKESVWEGGGNAGECFEVLIRGLEVATLVFMHYEVRDGRYVELPLRIVDTGYGLERIYWLLRGSPTIYDAVFGQFIDRVRIALGVERPPEDVLARAAVHFGRLDPELIGLSKAYELVAQSIGADPRWFEGVMRAQEALYVLADHGRSVAWMIADGVIPSNAGAGYLARLLIRRMLRYLRFTGAEVPLAEIMSVCVRELRREYPEVGDAESLILELVEMEERKFREVLKSAPAAVKRALEEARRSGREALSVDDIVVLYDSHGIPPETAAEVARRLGVEVRIPDDFYSRLAARHGARGRRRERQVVEMSALAELPRTRELFYEDPYMKCFKASVLRVIGGKYVVLDQTAFYPEGGGQPADTGVLRHAGGIARVVDVRRVGHVIVHAVEGNVPQEGADIIGEIDWERRYGLMKMHTGTHILLQSIRRVLGSHIWQAGAQKDLPFSRLDVTHYKMPSAGEIAKIERLANEIVQANLPVRVKVMLRSEAESKYGFVLYQGGAAPSRDLRVVQIGDEGGVFDVQACGGTHVRLTGEIGVIKIVRVERIAEGAVRFVLSTGLHVLEYVQRLEQQAAEAASVAGGSRDELVEAVKRLLHRAGEWERRARRYAELYASLLAGSLRTERAGNYELAAVELDDDELARKLALAATSRNKSLVLVVTSGKRVSIYTGGLDVEHIMSALREAGFKGGGSKTFAQGVYEGSVESLLGAVKAALTRAGQL